MKYRLLTGLSATLGLILAGCSVEEPVNVAGSGEATDLPAGIEICGGRPSGLALSRGAEPAALGYCNADKIDFRVYRTQSNAITQPKPDFRDLKPVAAINGGGSMVSEDITEYSGAYSQNKALNWNYTALIEKYVTAFYIPALAYTHADAPLFDYPAAENPADMTFSLKKDDNGRYKTPEVYFGRLSFTTGNKKLDDVCSYEDGFQWYRRGLVLNSDFTGECPVGGRLYRIVSGLTAQIEDVNPKIVTKMEMYLSNIPISILLYGNHGEFYPIGAASATDQHTAIAADGEDPEWIKVAENDDMDAETVTLSTFLLPSTVGRSLMMRVHFAEGALKDEAGNSVDYRDYVIRAPKSVFLTGDDAAIYLAGAPGTLKGGNGVYLYDVSSNNFFSYSNVRINLKGSFNDFFTPKQDVDFKIEVCPSFDRVHNDIEIDY